MILQVYANESNVGDWMSAIGIRRLLSAPSLPRLYCDEYFLPETLQTIRAMDHGNVLLIGGGGLFQPYFLPFWRSIDDAINRGVQVVVWGVGLCGDEAVLTPESQSLLRTIAARSRLCVVRDELTRRFLSVENAPSPVPCPSIPAARQMILQASDRHGILHVAHHDLLAPTVCRRITQIVKTFAGDSGRTFRQTDNRTPQGDGAALKSTLALYAAAGLIVSSRLHGCILGLAAGCRVLALRSDPKIEAFMNLAGLGEWVCDPADADRVRSLLDVLDTQSFPSQFVEQACRENARVAAQVCDLVNIRSSLREGVV